MTDARRLAVELDGFDQIVAELEAVAARSDPARRSELVALRRRLSDQIVRMRDLGARAFAAAPDPGLATDFRSRLSAALHVVAMHQANWPAVSIDCDNAAYRRSCTMVSDSNRDFTAWTRAALARTG